MIFIKNLLTCSLGSFGSTVGAGEGAVVVVVAETPVVVVGVVAAVDAVVVVVELVTSAPLFVVIESCSVKTTGAEVDWQLPIKEQNQICLGVI